MSDKAVSLQAVVSTLDLHVQMHDEVCTCNLMGTDDLDFCTCTMKLAAAELNILKEYALYASDALRVEKDEHSETRAFAEGLRLAAVDLVDYFNRNVLNYQREKMKDYVLKICRELDKTNEYIKTT